MSDIEKLIDDTAFEIGTDSFSAKDVLKRKFLPLLEAGQAMRDDMDGINEIEGLSYFTAHKAWDAALEKAKRK